MHEESERDARFTQLQRLRGELLGLLRDGREKDAVDLGTEVSPPEEPGELWVPVREMTGLIAVDVAVAGAMRGEVLDELITGVLDGLHRTRRTPPWVEMVTGQPIVPVAWTPEQAQTVIRLARGVSEPVAAAPQVRIVHTYLHQDIVAMQTCPHGRKSIIGGCAAPPCPSTR